jgi:hypothetical protein
MMTRDFQAVGQKMEQMISKEIGLKVPISWSSVGDEQQGNRLKDGLIGAFGGKLDVRNSYIYTFSSPRPVQLLVSVVQAGMFATVPATLTYTTELNKPAKSIISLSKSGSIFKKKCAFEGDAETCAKLNSNEEIIKIASKFYVEKSTNGSLEIKIYPRFEISPSEKGSSLLIHTIPHGNWKGENIFCTKDFFRVIDLLEQTLL